MLEYVFLRFGVSYTIDLKDFFTVGVLKLLQDSSSLRKSIQQLMHIEKRFMPWCRELLSVIRWLLYLADKCSITFGYFC